jgi:lysine 2,3-aminomutase
MRFHFRESLRPASVQSSDWQSWIWQLQNSFKNEDDFASVFELSAEEKASFAQGSELFNIRTTPYYASLARHSLSLRQIFMPQPQEIAPGLQQMLDPLGERKNNPAPRIIHRYPDRALFLITDICSVYCRFCTRKHFTGQEQAFIKKSEYEQALNYLRTHPGIREVILSGGDPLTVSDAQLDRVLSDLRAIEHIEIIRIGSRMPVVCPMRVTPELVGILKKHKPVYLMTHFNHPKELTIEAAKSLDLFVDNGIPVMNQMVLLNGINNHPALVQALNRRLVYLRVKPYYMFQCDPSIGTDHLRTSIEDSLEIQKELWGNLSGLAMANLSVDIPDGGGKTYLVPNFEVAHEENSRKYRGWDGVEAEYLSPKASEIRKPADAADYIPEWEELKKAKLL